MPIARRPAATPSPVVCTDGWLLGPAAVSWVLAEAPWREVRITAARRTDHDGWVVCEPGEVLDLHPEALAVVTQRPGCRGLRSLVGFTVDGVLRAAWMAERAPRSAEPAAWPALLLEAVARTARAEPALAAK
ncbi:MAG: hypothetical protein R3F61_06945 [Myxococcota bacterium]